MAVALRLKYQLLSVKREIRFGIFAAERKLFDIREMLFTGNLERILRV
jgi:hypothetical protein